VIGTIAAKTIREQRRALIGWSAGMIGLVAMYGAFFPSIRGNAAQLETYLSNLPEAFRREFGGGADFAGVRWLETLVNGLPGRYAALFVGLIAAFSIAAVAAFDRRDVAD
jgi:hypothetical protein